MAKDVVKLRGQLERLSMEHYLLPWNSVTDQPVFVKAETDQHLVIPIFSSEDKLRAAMDDWVKPQCPWTIKHIDDGPEFIEAIGKVALVALDPYPHEGKMRYTGVLSTMPDTVQLERDLAGHK